MTATSVKTGSVEISYVNDDDRWQALVTRDPAADGLFFYSVKTTGVYCRSVCAAPLPNRKNVRFHATCADAEKAGFRPCKRCQPTADRLDQRRAAVVARACRLIEDAVEPPSLDQIAGAVAMSPHHFHRLFKAHTGVTPKAYADAQRVRRVRGELARGASVTDAIYGAGFNSNSRFYATANEALGMAAKSFRAGGAGAAIRFAVGECWLGSILVAATDKGVCAILLGDDPDELVRDLVDRFPKAELVGGDSQFEELVAAVVGFVERPAVGLDLPLDIRGTAFQQRVWEALRAVPTGSTTSYAAIARQIGRPKSARAVGQAIAANPLAVAIPCHRVVRSDGSLCGYRWGVQRKGELLRRERGAT